MTVTSVCCPENFRSRASAAPRYCAPASAATTLRRSRPAAGCNFSPTPGIAGVLRAGSAAAALHALLLLSACAGGAGTPSAAPAPAAAPLSAEQSDELSLAQQLYAGVVRVPAGFRVDPPPANVTGEVATLHLKNTDVTPSAGAGTRYEVCADDLATVIAWSELAATWRSSYTALVQTSSDAQYFEVDRVPQSDPTAMLRHRVFRCSYLDRSSSDLAVVAGPAGVLNARPIAAADLQALAEYLWHFTTYNNADTVVTGSVGSGSAPALSHAIRMAQLQSASIASDCDTIQLSQWVHDADTDSGVLTRHVDALGSFRARNDQGVVSLCN